MIEDEDLFELLYPKREIGVSHYPMPSNPIISRDLSNLNFLAEDVRDRNRNGMLLYLHIPFCETICSFCPYNKVKLDNLKVDRYLKALSQEIEWYQKTKYVSNHKIEAIYFGGGTPSVLSAEQLLQLLSQIKKGFYVASDVEITIEGNPASFSEDKLQKLLEAGVNRISLGIQTFNDEIGQLLDLPHSSSKAVEVIRKIKELGFPNLSIDLMYNLPKQTMEIWREDLEKAANLKIDHITLFHLVVVPETRLFQQVKKGELMVGDLLLEVKMFNDSIDALTSQGYTQQSTYDFGLPNKTHKYGLKHFVEGYELLGLGMGSFGEVNKKSYINTGNFNEYIQFIENEQLPILLQNDVTEKESLYAILPMGLRFLEVEVDKFYFFNENPFELFSVQFEKLIEKNLIECKQEKIRLTRKGKLWGNNICKEFYSEEYKASLPAWQRMEELARPRNLIGREIK